MFISFWLCLLIIKLYSQKNIFKVSIKTKTLLNPWFTKGIKKSSEKKQKLYEKFLKKGTKKKRENL